MRGSDLPDTITTLGDERKFRTYAIYLSQLRSMDHLYRGMCSGLIISAFLDHRVWRALIKENLLCLIEYCVSDDDMADESARYDKNPLSVIIDWLCYIGHWSHHDAKKFQTLCTTKHCWRGIDLNQQAGIYVDGTFTPSAIVAANVFTPTPTRGYEYTHF
jgi:hypothetical protein